MECSKEIDLTEVIRKLIPRMTDLHIKGQCGRVGIIGGCEEYPGAAYFAGISALKVGADLSHIFCSVGAATTIRSYSPELIVHPVIDTVNAIQDVVTWLPRLQSLVIGPGLGYDKSVLQTTKTIILKAKERNMPIIIDAHAIIIIANHPELISGYKSAIVTLNIKEFVCLYSALVSKGTEIDYPTKEQVETLAIALGHVTVVCKGHVDIITDGLSTAICMEEGSNRRCWGQGDLLSGALGSFIHWFLDYKNNKKDEDDQNSSYGPLILSGYAACLLTRKCNKCAFQKEHRSMTTSNMINFIGQVFNQHFESR